MMNKFVLVALVFMMGGPGVALNVAAQNTSDAWVQDIGAPQYFAVLVADVDRSVAWYTAVFGLTEIGGSRAEDGSWRIENLRNDELFVEIIRDDRAQAVDRAHGFRKVGFFVPDVDVVADRVAQATGDRPRVSTFAEYGLRLIQLKDPDGNTLQLSSLLPSQDE